MPKWNLLAWHILLPFSNVRFSNDGTSMEASESRGVKGDFGRIVGDICGKEGRARLGRTLSDNRGC